MRVKTHVMRHILGHVELYTQDGAFVVSGDTEEEAFQNLGEILLAREQLTNEVA